MQKVSDVSGPQRVPSPAWRNGLLLSRNMSYFLHLLWVDKALVLCILVCRTHFINPCIYRNRFWTVIAKHPICYRWFGAYGHSSCQLKGAAVDLKCCLLSVSVMSKETFWTFRCWCVGIIFLILVPIVTIAKQSLLSSRLIIHGLVCIWTLFTCIF